MNADLRGLARQLGGDVAGRDSVLAPGPGHSPKDRSLHVTFSTAAPDGFIVNSFAGDDWQTCRDYVRRKLGLPDWQPGDERDRAIHPSRIKAWDHAAVDAQADNQQRTDDDLIRIKRANELWCEAGDPRGTLAEKYLKLRRLELEDDLAGTILRFHPACPWRNENTGRTDRVPALVAAFRSIDDDTITAIHRIALKPDGSKLGRRMLGIVHRSAVKLDQANGSLAVGEGVETAMAARILGYRPAWALGSLGAISFFPVIRDIERLDILAETGADEAVRLCGTRWHRAGRQVRVIRPDCGTDLNDELMAIRRGQG